MELIIYGLAILFIIMGVILIIKQYHPIFVSASNNVTAENENDIEEINDKIAESINVLRSDTEPSMKAKAFISLIELSYVKIHKLINQGEDYNDKKQHEKFVNSLTPDILDALNNIEGKYE